MSRSTIEQFADIVRRLDVSGFRFPIKLEVSSYDGHSAYLAARCQVPDRDDPDCDAFVTHRRGYEPHAFTSEEDILRFVRSFLHEVVAHELDEHLLFDGQRRWDPHR